METKQEIRKKALLFRSAMSIQERRRRDILVTERLLGHQWYYGAEQLLLFLNYGTEIDTGMILSDAWEKGKRVYVPKVENGNIRFYRIKTLNDVREGYKGIREPSGREEGFVYIQENLPKILLVMPGAAFDRRRNRIGYGGGYYDRFLQDKPGMHKIAIGYSCQMFEEIPAEEYDIKPDQVICL